MKKKFNEFKEKVNNKVEEIKSKKEDQEMETTEKKGMPKWLKGTLIGLGAAGAAAGCYMLGKHNGGSSEVDDYYDDDFVDSDIESEE